MVCLPLQGQRQCHLQPVVELSAQLTHSTRMMYSIEVVKTPHATLHSATKIVTILLALANASLRRVVWHPG